MKRLMDDLFIENVIWSVKEFIRSIRCMGDHDDLDMGAAFRCRKCGRIKHKKDMYR